jgi:multidrug efflux pump subunit AcrB
VETIPLERFSPGLNLMLRDVARVGVGTLPGEYDRTSMQRYLSITANVEGEDLGRASKQIDEALQQAGQPPKGVHVENRGQIAPMNEMFESLAIGLAVAVAVILVLLTAYFQSGRLAIASIGAVPGVLSGVVLMLYFTGTTLNIESFMGAIMSVGVSVSNSVMLVTFTSREWMDGATVLDASEKGAKERLRPILMTACAMIVGMVPMALALESGSQMEAPLGRAVVGGLLVSTFATLLILPAFFAIVMGNSKHHTPSLHPDDSDSKHFDPENKQSDEVPDKHNQQANEGHQGATEGGHS